MIADQPENINAPEGPHSQCPSHWSYAWPAVDLPKVAPSLWFHSTKSCQLRGNICKGNGWPHHQFKPFNVNPPVVQNPNSIDIELDPRAFI